MAKKKSAAAPVKAKVLICPSDLESVRIHRKPIYMATYSGMRMDFANLRVDHIEANDIVVSLCNVCRFTGHVGRHYSVAQHSLNCLLLANHLTDSPELQLAALIHDAHEAYIGDINRPTRKMLTDLYDVDWKRVEKHFNAKILAKFGLPEDLLDNPLVKQIDDTVLALEDEVLQLGYGTSIDSDFLSPQERLKVKLSFGPMDFESLQTHFTCNLRHYLGKVRSL